VPAICSGKYSQRWADDLQKLLGVVHVDGAAEEKYGQHAQENKGPPLKETERFWIKEVHVVRPALRIESIRPGCQKVTVDV
jgi:hypothetical protein